MNLTLPALRTLPQCGDHVSKLLEALALELERPRELSAKVISYIGGTYGIDYDAIGVFLVEELTKLEDYEVDLILSPVFTPTLSDQAIFAELVGAESVPREQWPSLMQQLAIRPTRAQLVTADGRAHSVTLREVTLERYVHRLRLDAAIPESLFELLDRAASSSDRPLLKAIARRAVFESEGRRDILFRYLTTAVKDASYGIADAVELLNLVENFKPAHVADLLTRIPHRQQVLRSEIDGTSGPKPFFSARVQELHGGERDQRLQDDARLSAKQNELAFLNRLEKMLSG